MAVESQFSRRIAIASLWALLTQVTAQALRAGASLVYAFFLSPGDFGVFFFGMAVIALGQTVLESGPGQALVQSDEDETSLFNTTFVLMAGIGLAACAVMFVLAPTLASLLGRPTATVPLQVLSFYLVLFSLSRTHIAIARRQLRFRQIMWIETAVSITPLVLGVPLAAMGHGVWAPVTAALLGALIGVVCASLLVGWRPAPRFDAGVAVDILRFSRWTMLDGVLGWLSAWGAAFFIGVQLSAHETGLFRTGELLPRIVFGAMMGGLVPVIYSGLSRLKHDVAATTGVIHEYSRFIGITGAVFGVGLFITADAIEAVLGVGWEGLAFIIMLQAGGQMFSSILTPLQPCLLAAGRPKLALGFRFVVVGLLLPLYIFVVPFGIVAFLWARLAVRILLLGVGLIIVARGTPVRIRAFVKEPVRFFAEGVAFGVASMFVAGMLAPAGPIAQGVLAAFIFIAMFSAWMAAVHRRTIVDAYQALMAYRLQPDDKGIA